MNIVWAKKIQKFSLGILKMHNPKKIVILELCFLFNSLDASMNMIVLKACVSAGSESVGCRLMWRDEVLGSRKYTMRKKYFTFFAWKTTRIYGLIIQCTGLNASCFCLSCKSFFSHYECSSPVNNWCTFFASAMVTVDARAVGCSPSCSRVSCPKSPPGRLWWIARLAPELPSVSEEWIGLLETWAKALACPSLGWSKA